MITPQVGSCGHHDDDVILLCDRTKQGKSCESWTNSPVPFKGHCRDCLQARFTKPKEFKAKEAAERAALKAQKEADKAVAEAKTASAKAAAKVKAAADARAAADALNSTVTSKKSLKS
jgi:hypothetical protein